MVDYTIAALSYRGFWSSRGRPSQRGIERDAEAVLDWVVHRYCSRGESVRVVLWGQSIGAGVATAAAARYSGSKFSHHLRPEINGLLLETPFTSVKDMLVTLYPQKWLPYRYLWPFLWNWWDSREALNTLGRPKGSNRIKVMILQAGKDELVPPEHGLEIEQICRRNDMEVQRKEVAGALHTEVIGKAEGRAVIVDFLEDIGRS